MPTFIFSTMIRTTCWWVCAPAASESFQPKLFTVMAHILHKHSALSIGEYVATTMANIHRHCMTLDAVSQPGVLRHGGYVDDCLTFFQGTFEQVRGFIRSLDRAIYPFTWTHSIRSTGQDFLDLSIHKVQESGYVYFETGLFRTPNLRPHYLSCFSDHAVAHKLFCETYCILVCCARSSVFDKCLLNVASYLHDSGHPSSDSLSFDGARRSSVLQAALLQSNNPYSYIYIYPPGPCGPPGCEA